VKQQVGVAKQQVGRAAPPIPKVLVFVPLVILAAVAVYALASLANGSLASGLVETGIVAGIVVILLLARWLITRDEAPTQKVGNGPPLAGEANVRRGASWPPGKFAGRAETMPAATQAASEWKPRVVPTSGSNVAVQPVLPPPPNVAVQPVLPPPPRIAPARPRVAAAAPRVAPAPVAPTSVASVVPATPAVPVAPVAPVAPARVAQAAPVAPTSVSASMPSVVPTVPTGPTSVPGVAPVAPAPVAPPLVPGAATSPPVERATKPEVAPSTGGHQSPGEPTPALASPGGASPESTSSGSTSALAEYLEGRAELANLIATVEARMPPEIEPDAPLDELDETAEPGLEQSRLSLAQNTKILTRAVEQVGRACEMIAQACELLAERVESDRVERHALTEAVSTLAQQHSPPASTPKLLGGSVFASPVWPHDDEIVIEDDPADHRDAPLSSPLEQSGSASTRVASPAPRQSTWSGAPTQSTPSVPSQPQAPRLPSSPNGR